MFYSSKSIFGNWQYLIISADKTQSPDDKKLIMLEFGQWNNL